MVTPAIMQAIMQLIYKQEYFSWKLPKNSTILLTSNSEEDGSSVIEMDEAQKTRLLNFNIKFNIEDWAQYAEEAEIDNRAINFLLSYYEELFSTKNKATPIANARSYTMFANTISGIQDWSNPKSLAMILQIASGCFLDDDNIVGHLFTTFIANKLDKLISPEDMLMKKWIDVKPRIESCVYDSEGNYHPEIASILSTRLLNYSIYYFKKPKSKTDIVQDRILDIVNDSTSLDNDKKLFSEDLVFNVAKTLITMFPSRTNKFLMIPKLRDKLM